MKRALLLFFLFGSIFALGQTSWTDPIYVGSYWNASQPKMKIVNGNPAICHRNNGQDILFLRAIDSCGDSWDTPINVSSAYIPNINCVTHPEMIIVDGHPAICFMDNTNDNFIYCRADDPNGNSWTQFKIIDTGNRVGGRVSMYIVDGYPAMVYPNRSSSNGSCLGDIRYVRALDAQGTNWGSFITIATDQCNYWTANTVDLQILNGNPAVFMQLTSNNGPGDPWGAYFLRANDAEGTSWPAAQLIYAGGYGSNFTVVDNKPQVLVKFQDDINFIDSLGIAVSLDDNGSSWNGSLDKIDFGGSDIGTYFIHQFDNKVWVSGAVNATIDSLVYVSSPSVHPLVFGSKETIVDDVISLLPHELNMVCGELGVVYQYSGYHYTRTFQLPTYYQDLDSDGFGNPNVSMQGAIAPMGFVADGTDCDDNNPTIKNPGSACDDGFACTIATVLNTDCLCSNPESVNSVTNTFVGSNDLWMHASNWSLNEVPDLCHAVIIPANKSVKIKAGESGICYSLEVSPGGVFETEEAGELEVIVLGF